MNLKFRDVLRMFFNVDFSLENELNVNNNIREGLEDYIQYFRSLVDAHKKYLTIVHTLSPDSFSAYSGSL